MAPSDDVLRFRKPKKSSSKMSQQQQQQGAEDPLATLQALMTALLTTPRPQLPELPTYGGLDHENPETYIVGCQAFFTAHNVPADYQVPVATRGLRGDAEKWWQPYRFLPFTFARYCELLRARFNNASILGRLQSDLYSRKQGEKESVTKFLQEKYLFFQRINPNTQEATMITTVLELIRPTIRKSLRDRTYDDYSALLSLAIKIEADDEEEQRVKARAAKSSSEKSHSEKSSTESRTTPIRPPKCNFCPEYHYHRDCPIRKSRAETTSGNETGAKGPATTSAPASTSRS